MNPPWDDDPRGGPYFRATSRLITQAKQKSGRRRRMPTLPAHDSTLRRLLLIHNVSGGSVCCLSVRSFLPSCNRQGGGVVTHAEASIQRLRPIQKVATFRSLGPIEQIAFRGLRGNYCGSGTLSVTTSEIPSEGCLEISRGQQKVCQCVVVPSGVVDSFEMLGFATAIFG